MPEKSEFSLRCLFSPSSHLDVVDFNWRQVNEILAGVSVSEMSCELRAHTRDLTLSLRLFTSTSVASCHSFISFRPFTIAALSASILRAMYNTER